MWISLRIVLRLVLAIAVMGIATPGYLSAGNCRSRLNWRTHTASAAAFYDPASTGQSTYKQTPSSKNVTVFGSKIHYLEAGAGPDVVLLHGLGGDSSHWAFNINALSHRFHVIVPDQIGFGMSDKPLINYRVGTLVDFLDKFFAELNLNRVTLVGNSFGGWIAADYTIEHPDKVTRLVLVDSAGFALPKDFDMQQLSALNPSTREQMRALAGRVIYNSELFVNEAMIDLMFTRHLTAGDGFTIDKLIGSLGRSEDVLDNRLGKIKVPVLIIWGKQDGLLPLSDGERFKKEITGARLIVFDQCGHAPMVEQAAKFNDEVIKFISAPVQ